MDVFSHAGQGGYDNPYARGHKVGAKGQEQPGGPKTLSSEATAALFGEAAAAKVRKQEEAHAEKYKVVSQGTSVGGGVNKPVSLFFCCHAGTCGKCRLFLMLMRFDVF